MLGYREGKKKLVENTNTTTCSSLKSSSAASKTGSIKPSPVPVHDLIQEELEKRAVKILSCSNTRRLPQHLVTFNCL